MLAKYWEQNKPFLLRAGIGCIVFLFLNGMLRGYVDRADKILTQAGQHQSEIRKLKKKLKHMYAEEQKRHEDYTRHEENLRKLLELPALPEYVAFDPKSPRVQFNQAISRIWDEARRDGNRIGVALPEKLGPDDFDIERGATRQEYAAYYDELAIVGLALRALVLSGMSEIRSPKLLTREEFEIPGSPGYLCSLKGGSFDVTGSYDSFVQVLKSVQEDGSFLEVRINRLELKPKKDDVLVGTLDFIGVRILEAAAAESAGEKAARR